jgi:hypothetical protein
MRTVIGLAIVHALLVLAALVLPDKSAANPLLSYIGSGSDLLPGNGLPRTCSTPGQAYGRTIHTCLIRSDDPRVRLVWVTMRGDQVLSLTLVPGDVRFGHLVDLYGKADVLARYPGGYRVCWHTGIHATGTTWAHSPLRSQVEFVTVRPGPC